MAYNPPIGSIYHLYPSYILPSGGLYASYHLLGEPETTIETAFLLGVIPGPFSNRVPPVEASEEVSHRVL